MDQDKYEVLKTAAQYAKKLEQGAVQAAEHYRNSEFGKGNEYVSLVTEGIEWLVNVLALTGDDLIDKIDPTDINSLVGEYIEAIENEDTVLMADLLEYEIAEEINKWQEVLQATIMQYSSSEKNED